MLPEDIYSAIVGDPLTEREKLGVIVDKLRNQKLTGQLGMLSGDKVLSPLGKGVSEDTEENAALIGKLGEQARYRGYQEEATAGRLKLGYAQLAADKEDMALRRAMAKLKAEKGEYRTMTVPQMMKLQDEATSALEYTNMANEFENAYAGTDIPGERGFKNFLATNAPILASPESEAAAAWWAKYGNIHTLPERHKLFGSALTGYEREEWRKNAISTNMTAKQIYDRLTWYQNKSREVISRRSSALKAMKFDPAEIDELYNVDLDLSSPPPEEEQVERIELSTSGRRASDRGLPGEGN